MLKDIISIIIPIHNTGVYLKYCLDSLILQSHMEWEVLCVDDASNDAITLEILGLYASKDKRIRVFTLESNSGAAEARNYGLERANGKYVMFLDSDDLYETDMLESMYLCLCKTKADYCVSSYSMFDNVNGEEIQQVSPVDVVDITDRVFELSELGESGLCHWNTGPCNKLYRKEFIINNDLRFQTLKSSNDVSFSLLCALNAAGITYCRTGHPLQSYRVNNPKQISANRHVSCFLLSIFDVLKRYDDKYCLPYIQTVFYMLSRVFVEMNECRDEDECRLAYEELKSFVIDWYTHEVFESQHTNKIALNIINRDYDNRWFELFGSYDKELQFYKSDLINEIGSSVNNRIVVWGMGKRGKAYLRFLRGLKLSNCVCTDKHNDHVGEVTEEGFSVIHTSEVDLSSDLIIASNEAIYFNLIHDGSADPARVINGHMYCF